MRKNNGQSKTKIRKSLHPHKRRTHQSIIIDALVGSGYDVDVEVTDNGTGNEVVSCEIYDVGGGSKKNG